MTILLFNPGLDLRTLAKGLFILLGKGASCFIFAQLETIPTIEISSTNHTL